MWTPVLFRSDSPLQALLLCLSKDKFKVRHLLSSLIVLVLACWEFVWDLDFHDFLFKWLQYFVLHVLQNLKVGHLRCLLQKVLSEMLVDIPNVTRLKKFKMARKSDIWSCIMIVVKHVVGAEEIPDKGVPDIVILSESCDQSKFWSHIDMHFLKCLNWGWADTAEDENVLMPVLEALRILTFLVSTMVIYPGEVFSQFGDQTEPRHYSFTIEYLDKLVGQQTIWHW